MDYLSLFTNFITTLINLVSTILLSDLLLPFFGIWVAVFIVALFFKIMKGGR